MYHRQNLIDRIIEMLAFVKAKVELSSPINLTDINIISENFYRDFLNLLFGYELINININEPNAAAIDLGDKKRRISIQVTSTASITKVKKTVNSFIEKKLYQEYDRLVILNIVSKSNHQAAKIGDSNKYELNTDEDIWDMRDLVKEVNDLTTTRIEQIFEHLKKEIKFDADISLAKEISTFMSLIAYLSDESQPSAGSGFIEAPDPDGKINSRFSNHANFLKKEYQDLYIEYGQVLSDVIKQSDIGHTRIRRLGLHLKNTSDKKLTEMNGDAKLALESLVEEYGTILSTNAINFDQSAIRFFLVDQLIRCNVFPNKVENV